jgi:anti-sigma regulatory factor (Ser/Thr protein kinase)
MPKLTKVFLLSLDSMEQIIPWIVKHTPIHLIEKLSQNKYELALEEIIVNVFEHAYKGKHLPIFIHLDISSSKLICHIRDCGSDFDILAHNSSRVGSYHIDDMKIGGQGIKFVKAVLSNIQHHYCEGLNILKFEIN